MKLRLALVLGTATALTLPLPTAGDHIAVRIQPLEREFALTPDEVERGFFQRNVLRISPPGAASDPRSTARFCLNMEAPCSASHDGDIEGETVRIDTAAHSGRYEAVLYAWSGFHQNRSNVVRFDVVDPCRWTGDMRVSRGLQPLPGGPVPCMGSGRGSVDLRSSDGSRLRMSGRIEWRFTSAKRRQIPMDVLLLFGEGSGPVIHFQSRARIGGFLTIVQTAGAQVAMYGPADVQITHLDRVTTVSVKRGFAAGLRDRDYQLYHHIRRRCGGKPTAKCLGRIRYVVGGQRKRVERATIVRPGQTARFRYRGV